MIILLKFEFTGISDFLATYLMLHWPLNGISLVCNSQIKKSKSKINNKYFFSEKTILTLVFSGNIVIKDKYFLPVNPIRMFKWN